jgi:thymidylate kinase
LAVRQASTATTPDRIEREAAAFHERVRNGFLALAAEEPERLVVISTERDPAEVAAAVRHAVEILAPLRGVALAKPAGPLKLSTN